MQLPEYDAQPADEQREEAWNPPPPEYAASTVMRSLRPLGLIPEFCRHSAIILLRIPDLSSYTEDDFVIKDTSDGSTVFEIRATGSWSPGHKRALCDHSGRPLFGFRKAGTSYIAYNCNNERETLFTIESAGLLKPGYKITFSNRVSADGKREQWHAGGRWCSGTSKITTELGRVVASKDQDQFSWSKAFAKKRYGLTIFPGIDAALVTAISTCLDDIDFSRHKRRKSHAFAHNNAGTIPASNPAMDQAMNSAMNSAMM